MPPHIAIVWFRQDLRLSDNRALYEASKDHNILPIYIFDSKNAKDFKIGSASLWWVHNSLKELNKSLDNKLNVFEGDPKSILPELAKKYNCAQVFWNRCYEPWVIERDKTIKADLESQNIKCKTFNSSLLWEPWEIKKQDNAPYKVFTPFYSNALSSSLLPSAPLPKPKNLKLIPGVPYSKTNYKFPKWSAKLKQHWNIGERGAEKALENFIDNGLSNYEEGRNFPALENVSRLSPHIHFGEISINTIWHKVKQMRSDKNTETFLKELVWREFSYNLLYHFPNIPTENLQQKFNAFAWENDDIKLQAWQKGMTGYPIVDAGMRELWETGYMHNRVRMIVGSFLVKNLLIDWRKGEEWFWECLVDADLANNSANWQWVAGCGTDSSPYFRIFNPVTQAKKFDPDGAYIKKFVPELAKLPNKYLFTPWETPKEILKGAGIEIGNQYPNPIVDLELSRKKALSVFSSLS